MATRKLQRKSRKVRSARRSTRRNQRGGGNMSGMGPMSYPMSRTGETCFITGRCSKGGKCKMGLCYIEDNY